MAQLVKMPDGVTVSFPDGMPKEEIGSLIEKKFPKEVAAKKGGIGNEIADYATQGLSGFNEGLANFGDAAATIASGGFIRGTGDIAKQVMTNAGAIQPPSEDDGKEFVRRVGEEVGASVIPGGALVARAARPVALMGAELVAALGSGTGAAVAEKVAPGNPVAEAAGQLVGGLTPAAIVGATRRAALGGTSVAGPTLDDLRAAKDAAYKTVDTIGAAYRPESYKGLHDAIVDEALRMNISQHRHKDALSLIDDIEKRYPNGLTLTELDQLRQEVVDDLVGSSERATRKFGYMIRGQIDDFIENAKPSDMAGGDGQQAFEAITAARAANRQYRATELVDEAIDSADLRAASTGSGGNINNTLRQELKKLIDDPKKARSFTPEQLKELEDVVRQGKMEGVLRWVGKTSPGGNGLALLLHLAGTAANPAWAVVPAVGALSKHAADTGTVNRAMALRSSVASGNALKRPGLLSKEQKQAQAALSLGQGSNVAANDNRALRMQALN
jgi:hypothetical protein